MKILYTLLLTLCFASLQAQAIIGQVIDSKSGEGIPFANLLILGDDRGTAADEKGRFELESKRIVIVRVSAIGFQADTVSLNPDITHPLRISLEQAADLPTITISEQKWRPLTEITYEDFRPAFLTTWQDRVVICFKRSGSNEYELRVLSREGQLHRFDLDFGELEGITSRCSDNLILLTESDAIRMELGDEIRLVDRLPRKAYELIYDGCQDHAEEEFLYEQRQLQGLLKSYFIFHPTDGYHFFHEYYDTVKLTAIRRRPEMIRDWGRLGLDMPGSGGKFYINHFQRRLVSDALFNVFVQDRNHNDNLLFYKNKQIKLINFDHYLIESFDHDGQPVSAITLHPLPDKRVQVDQRLFRDAITGETYLLGKRGQVHLVYALDVNTGACREILELEIETVGEIAIMGGWFYLLGRRDRFGPENQWRIYQGEFGG